MFTFLQKSEKALPRQLQQLGYIGQSSMNIIHILGSNNEVTDALSRLDVISMPVVMNTEELAEQQIKDPELPQVLKSAVLQLKKLKVNGSENTIYCDISTIRPYVPGALRRQIFDSVHNLAHPSGRCTRKMITKRFIWPGMSRKTS